MYSLKSTEDPRRNSLVAFGDSANLDAFSRLRISLPFTTFDQSLEYGLGQLFWNTKTSGDSSEITHDGANSGVLLTCGTEADAYVMRQTYKYNHYRPGKSKQIVCTGVFGAAAANVIRRVGYFDTDDGLFFEQNGSTDIALVKRSSTSGSPVDTRVVQADWNLDTLNGSGPSKITLDPSKGFILAMDLQWLGFGRVRMGFDIDGQIIYCHQFVHANSAIVPYMRTASLPIRYEISNAAIQGETHTLRQGCVSATAEDGTQDEPGLFFSASTGTTSRAVTTRRALISIRPKATIGPSSKVNRVPITLEAFSLLTGTNDCFYEIVYNPTFAGTPVWADPSTQSAVEYSIHGDEDAGAITNGLVVQSGYVASGIAAVRLAVLQAPLLSKLPLTLDMDGANPIAISLVATSMSGTSNNAAAVSWKEIR